MMKSFQNAAKTGIVHPIYTCNPIIRSQDFHNLSNYTVVYLPNFVFKIMDVAQVDY